MNRIWTPVAILVLAFTLSGCGANVGGYEPTFPATLRFAYWDPISGDSCWGQVVNWGSETATNVRLHLWYATAAGETVRVLREGQWFPVPAQITRGEARYPRVGTLSWDGGAAPEDPRAPSIGLDGPSPHWFAFGPDSMSATIGNNGGYAYHLTMTIENRNGVQEISHSGLDPLPRYKTAYFRSVPLSSSGTPVAPRILKIRWEDYGGIADSVVSPP